MAWERNYKYLKGGVETMRPWKDETDRLLAKYIIVFISGITVGVLLSSLIVFFLK